MKPKNKSIDRLIIFHDGHCKICNWWTRFVIKRDHADVFEFQPITSTKANQFFALNQSLKKDTIIVWDQENNHWVASQAIFKIISHLWGFPRVLLIFQFLPIRFSDWIYYLVARNRYRLFKKSERGQLPT